MGLLLQIDHHSAFPRNTCRSGDSADDDGTGSTHQGPNPSPVEATPASKGCVLLVDDDKAVRETMAELLEDEGFQPILAADAAEALAILRQDRTIDILVTDLTMPGEDGIALIRHARTIRNDLPAILVTGYAEQVTAISMIAGGNYHVLRKPVEGGRLISQLELLVAKPNP
jgi:DNA-binding NtrC family response regulator